MFKHALVQDTAYASLLRGRRQRIHADIARKRWRRSSPIRSERRLRPSRVITLEAGLADPGGALLAESGGTRALALGLCGNGSIC